MLFYNFKTENDYIVEKWIAEASHLKLKLLNSSISVYMLTVS